MLNIITKSPKSSIILLINLVYYFTSISYGTNLEKSYKIINKSSGLISNTIYEILQDSKGYVWFASNKGISIFDGKHFKNLTSEDGLPSNDIFSIFEDSKKRIWILAGNGQISFYHNDKLFTAQNTPYLRSIITNSWIKSIHEDKFGNIWFGTFIREVIKLDKNNSIKYFFHPYQTSDLPQFPNGRFISNFHSNKNNEIEFILTGHGLVKISNDIIIKNSKYYGKLKDVTCAHIDENKIYYSKNKKIIITDKNFNELIKISLPNIFNDITTIQHINNNELCIGDGRIVAILDKKTNKIRLVMNIFGCDKIYQDKDSVYWINSIKNGIYILSGKYTYFTKDKTKNSCFSIGKDERKNIYIGQDDSHLIIHNSINDTILNFNSVINPIGRGRINQIGNLEKDILIISCERRIILHKNNKFFFLPIGSKCFRYVDNKLYIGHSGNLYYLPKEFIDSIIYSPSKRFNTVDFKLQKFQILPGKRVTNIEFDSIYIYLNTDKGIYRGMRKWKLQNDNFKEYSKISSNFTYCISDSFLLLDEISIGLITLNRSKIQKISTNYKLEINSVNRIKKSFDDLIWICSNNGLYLISEPLKSSATEPKIDSFTINDGLLSNEVNDITYSQGKWWVATSGGVTVFDEAYFKTKNETPPKIVFRELLLNGSTTISDERPLVEGNTRIKFSVGCLSFKHFRNIRFRYKLHPRDYWRYSMDFDHELANLSRGKYQIQIQARSPFSPWSRSIMLPAFTILPPFWERWWVQYPLFGGGALLFGLLVFTGYRIRLNRIRMRNQLIDANLTALRAQIRPHFIANIINSVQIYFLNNKKEDAIVFLGTFGKMVRRILDTSEEEFITVSEELKQIREYLDFECRRTSRKIDYEIRFPDDMNINYIYLPTMLLQPILENAMIHGLQVGEITEGSVEIQFLFIQEKGQKLKKNEFNISLEGRMLISISDTGIGRAASSIKKHSSSRSFGVKSIQNRLKWISEKFDCEAFAIVEDLKNKYEEPAGTMVTLNLPLFIKDPFTSID
jgi:hypothetical protein